ncbi:MAG: DUF1273 family protein [Clostridia bacterium]|nr:DUF1273 family protein [Clostridia bacterium]
MTTCAFTGHREIKAEHKAGMPNLLLRAINFAYEKGCRSFITGGALGFDTVAAREVLRFRLSHPDVSLIVFVPCLDQDRAWSARQRESYDYILSSADEVKFISESYDKSCMKRRNRAMAEECDIMIGYVGRERSGAAQTFRMASMLGKECYNLYFELEKGCF